MEALTTRLSRKWWIQYLHTYKHNWYSVTITCLQKIRPLHWTISMSILLYFYRQRQHYQLRQIFSVLSSRTTSGQLLPEIITTCHNPHLTYSLLWHCWLGDRKGIQPVKKTGHSFIGGDELTGALHFARLIAPVVTTTSIILSSNKIQNGNILVPANPGLSGKWPLKWRAVTAVYLTYSNHSKSWLCHICISTANQT